MIELPIFLVVLALLVGGVARVATKGPIDPPGERRLSRWEVLAILFGLVSGPLLCFRMRGMGYAAYIDIPLLLLLLPILTMGIARSRRPLIFALVGNSGMAIFGEVLYLIGEPWRVDHQFYIVCLITIAIPVAFSVATGTVFHFLHKRTIP